MKEKTVSVCVSFGGCTVALYIRITKLWMKISLQKTECAFELENLNALNANVIRFAWFGDFLHIYFGIYVLCLLEFGFKFVTRHTHTEGSKTHTKYKRRAGFRYLIDWAWFVLHFSLWTKRLDRHQFNLVNWLFDRQMKKDVWYEVKWNGNATKTILRCNFLALRIPSINFLNCNTVVPIPKSLLWHYEYGTVLVIPFMVAIFQNQMQLTKTKTVCQALNRSMCKFIWSNSIPDIFMAIGDSLDRNLFVAHILHFTSFAIKKLFSLCRLIRYTSPHTELQPNAHKKNRPFFFGGPIEVFPVFQSRAKWMSKNQRLTQPHCSAELGMSMHIAELGNCSGLNIFAWLHYLFLFCSWNGQFY